MVSKKEHIFSLDKSEQKLPAILSLQVWDFETLSSDDFLGGCDRFPPCFCLCRTGTSVCACRRLGTVELDLHGFPRGAKTAKSCKADMLTDGTERISIFQQKRARGWWPFAKSGELTVRVRTQTHTQTTNQRFDGRVCSEPIRGKWRRSFIF